MLNIFAKINKESINVIKKFKEENIRVRKAMVTAIQVEAYRLAKEGKDDLRKNRLHLAPLVPLRKKSGRRQRIRKKGKAPLSGIAIGIRYKVDKKNMTASVGFLGQSVKEHNFRRIAGKSAPGYTIYYTKKFRRYMLRRGVRLKVSTKTAKVAARPIIKQIEKITGKDMYNNIKNNFRRKLKGERI